MMGPKVELSAFPVKTEVIWGQSGCRWGPEQQGLQRQSFSQSRLWLLGWGAGALPPLPWVGALWSCGGFPFLWYPPGKAMLSTLDG